MKVKYIYILLILFLIKLKSQDLYSKKISTYIDNFKKEYHKKGEGYLVKIDGESILECLKKSDKPWKVLYYYSIGCTYSNNRLKKIIPIWLENKDLIDVFIVSAPNKKDYNKFIDSTNKFEYPIFVIDNDLYGDVPYEYNRIFSFTKDIDPNGYINLKNITLGGLTYYDGRGDIKISTTFFDDQKENTDEKIILFTNQLFSLTKKYLEEIDKKK